MAALPSYPVLPLRDTVVFPKTVVPLVVNRPMSRAAVEAVVTSEDKRLVAVLQRDAESDAPTADGLAPIGTVAVVRNVARVDPEGISIALQGIERVRLLRVTVEQGRLVAQVVADPIELSGGPEAEALRREILQASAELIALLQPEGSGEALRTLLQLRGDAIQLVYTLATILGADTSVQAELLGARSSLEAMRTLHAYVGDEIHIAKLRRQISEAVATEVTQEQRKLFLRRNLEAIQRELGDREPEEEEVEQLRAQVAAADLSEDARSEADRQLRRLRDLPSASPEYHVIRTYIDLIVELPWRVATPDNLDLDAARRVLDEDHHDLHEVKDRIVEHLAVLKLHPQARGPILCFVGPPGTGKTSLGQSIARALGRKFERLSLGGVHDEGELRGHRRTYVGAMPGRILEAVRRAGSNNPLLMLDEVDKVGHGLHGDPHAALMEVLDPEQNRSFRDNYLDLPFDLSRVLFITTANVLDPIPPPLLDRMEVLHLQGYSEEEKGAIAARYLLPRQLAQAGLTPAQVRVPSPTLHRAIRDFTREAGVRQLDRALGRIVRRAAVEFARGRELALVIAPEDLLRRLGPPPFFSERRLEELLPGTSVALAWTEAGGEILLVEAALLRRGEGLTLTGQLGKVMEESARAAHSYVWAHAEELGVDAAVLARAGVHIHVPAGAIPKDGPSAGVAMATALTSVLAGVPMRDDTGMTGELTLTGRVLPIGGVKAKVLAARRAGLSRLILPRDNAAHVEELPDELRQGLDFVHVGTVAEALRDALPALHPQRPSGRPTSWAPEASHA